MCVFVAGGTKFYPVISPQHFCSFTYTCTSCHQQWPQRLIWAFHRHGHHHRRLCNPQSSEFTQLFLGRCNVSKTLSVLLTAVVLFTRYGFLQWKLKGSRSLEHSLAVRVTCTWTWLSPTKPYNTWPTLLSSLTRTGQWSDSTGMSCHCLLHSFRNVLKLTLICFCSFGVIPTSPLPVHTPLMPNQSIEISLPLNTIGPVMKMDPLNNLQVQQHTVATHFISSGTHLKTWPGTGVLLFLSLWNVCFVLFWFFLLLFSVTWPLVQK